MHVGYFRRFERSLSLVSTGKDSGTMATRKKQAEISIFWRPDWTVNKPLNTFQSVGATLCGVSMDRDGIEPWLIRKSHLAQAFVHNRGDRWVSCVPRYRGFPLYYRCQNCDCRRQYAAGDLWHLTCIISVCAPPEINAFLAPGEVYFVKYSFVFIGVFILVIY